MYMWYFYEMQHARIYCQVGSAKDTAVGYPIPCPPCQFGNFLIAYNLRSASMGVWVVGLSATLFKKVIIDSVGFVWFCALC